MRKVLELCVGAVTGCYLWMFVALCSQAQNFLRCQHVPLRNPWAALHRTPRADFTWEGAAEYRGQTARGWNRKTLEGERLAHLILISWGLRALKAQVSHTIPAVKTNSPFYFNLNQNTGACSKAKMTQLLHSKGISSTAGPHPKRYGEGPLLCGEKIIRRR